MIVFERCIYSQKLLKLKRIKFKIKNDTLLTRIIHGFFYS